MVHSENMSETDSMLPTRFFKTCRGVFQGGGCRAAALVGAYAMAHQVGVRFAEVAGTSAGSILAALIAAGADPKYIEVAVRDLDSEAFLQNLRGQSDIRTLELYAGLLLRPNMLNTYQPSHT